MGSTDLEYHLLFRTASGNSLVIFTRSNVTFDESGPLGLLTSHIAPSLPLPVAVECLGNIGYVPL
jgi:hypothetical protein